MSKVTRNILYNLLGQIALLLLALIGTRCIFKHLSGDALGLIYFSRLFSAILFSVLELGICMTVVREVSRNLNDTSDYTSDFLRTASLLFWGEFFLLAALAFFIAPLLAGKWLQLHVLTEETALYCIRYLSIFALLAFPKALYFSIMRGLQRMEYTNIIDILSNIVQQCGIVAILSLKGSIFMLIWWLSLCYLAEIVTCVLILRKFFSWKSLLPGFSGDIIRQNWEFSKNLIGLSFLSTIHLQLDKVIISKLLPISSLGYYSFAYGYAARGNIMTNAVATAVFPHLSEIHVTGDQKKLYEVYSRYHDIVCLCSVPVLAACFFFLKPVMIYIFNETVAKTLILPAFFLFLGTFLSGTLFIPYNYAIASGRPEIPRNLQFYALIFILPSMYLLIYHLGLLGASLAFVLYQLIAYIYFVPRVCSECLKMPLLLWYTHVLKVIITSCIIYTVSFSAVSHFASKSLFITGIAYIISTIIFLLISYHTMSMETRGFIMSSLAKIRQTVPEHC